MLQLHQPGDVTDPANRDFARSFIRNVADPGQEGAMVTADGSLSQEGAARMRAALVHRAYGDKGLSALSETKSHRHQWRHTPGNARSLGQSDSACGNQARGSVDGARRQEASGGGGGQQNGRLLEQTSLTPNFDQAAADHYAAARQSAVDRVATYKNAPGVRQALAPGQTAGSFKAPDSAIPRVIIRPGPQGASIAQAYLRAGGSVEELSNAAAYSLRQTAMRQDGTLDPVKYQAWARDRAGFLSQIPDAASRFGAAADAQRAATDAAGSSGLALKQATATAQRAVDDAIAARAMATKALQSSVLGKFLDGSDPVARVGSILRDKAMGRVQMAQLAKAVADNPEAKAGLQRAVGEFVTRELVGNAKGI